MSFIRVTSLLLLATLTACASMRVTDPPTVRVLVYNIHAGTDAGRVSNLERVASIVRDSRADVVLLQEVDRRTRRSGGIDQLDSLKRLSGMHGVFGKTIDYDGGEYGLGILSRWTILSDSLVHLPVSAPHAGYEARGALAARIDAPGFDIRVIDTHLDASRPLYRTEQATALAAVAAGPPAADIIGGDFNSTPEAGVIGILAGRGFRDLYPGCGPSPGFTFPVATPDRRIDYLLASDSWRCVTATVLPDDASDHRAILFVIVRR